MDGNADFSQKNNMLGFADFFLKKLTWMAMVIFT